MPHDPFDGISHPPKRAAVDTAALKGRIARDDMLIRANSARKTTPAGKSTVHTPTSLAATDRKAARVDSLKSARKGGY